ncbi:alpha/beta fold hydrolase [Roseomonas elaeocarpi]|uniref:Alpha/beta fold hydrolase n=1 Tax=Roseomonas elaeocarpi TaxID=907779 RepID=A0ABV6JM45_9PROT
MMEDAAAPERIDGTVVSRDGTTIGYSRFGAGTPLVVCHGAFNAAADWVRFARALRGSHSVLLYDRRGRGRSEAGRGPYSLAAEMDDLAAVVALAGDGAAVLGHSFGGGCALMYALRDGFRGRLVLYEAMSALPQPLGGAHLPALRALVAAGDHDAATAFALEHIVRTPPEKLALLRQTPLWPGMVALTPGFVQEAAALDTIAPTAAELAALRARPWLLLGERSEQDPSMRCTAALVERLRGATLYPIPGQGHAAHLFNPALLARIVARCLVED